MTELVRYDAMCRAIAEAHAIDEVKEIRDRMIAMEAYARQALNEDAERQAREIRLRAERRSGQMLAELMAAKIIDAGQGGNRKSPSIEPRVKRLSDFGISWDQSSQWQKLAEVPEKIFEAELAGENPSTTGIIERHESTMKKPLDGEISQKAVATEAIMLCGTLRDLFKDYVPKNQRAIMETMLPIHFEDIRKCGPPVIEWLINLVEEANAKNRT